MQADLHSDYICLVSYTLLLGKPFLGMAKWVESGCVKGEWSDHLVIIFIFIFFGVSILISIVLIVVFLTVIL